MPDDTPDESLDDTPENIDDAQLDEVRTLLGDLTFLDPAAVPATDPMPDDIWARLTGVLDSEAASRAAADHENVVVLTPSNRPSRGMRWAGGLVAASVAIVAVGLAVNTVRGGSSDPATVAGEAAMSTAPVAKAEDLTMQMAATPEAMSAPASDAPVGAAAPTVVPAARIVMASSTNYLPETLPGQVVSLVKNAGFTTPQEARAKVVPMASMPVDDGFTASWDALRACLTWLTQSSQSQALVVDRATYAGHDAGVIVAPAISPDADPATPSPAVTLETRYGAFDVWVVNPDCKEIEMNLDDFPLYEWKP